MGTKTATAAADLARRPVRTAKAPASVTKLKPKDDHLDADIRRYFALRTEIKLAEEEYDALKEKLLNEGIKRGGQFASTSGSVTVVEQARTSISKDRLLELGVTPRKIQLATIVTPVIFARVDAPK